MGGYEGVADEDAGGEGVDDSLLVDARVFEFGADLVLPCAVVVEQVMAELVQCGEAVPPVVARAADRQ